MANSKVPNWAQLQLQNAAGLGELELNVMLDNDSMVVFTGLHTGDEYLVTKLDGTVKFIKNPISLAKRSDRRRPVSVCGKEGFL